MKVIPFTFPFPLFPFPNPDKLLSDPTQRDQPISLWSTRKTKAPPVVAQRISSSSFAPVSVRLTLNRKHELQGPSPQDSLQSFGITSGNPAKKEPKDHEEDRRARTRRSTSSISKAK
ncbi:hypothetical protein Vadar_008487 [Vaccinium darrowii]|uniref:Uncharacterized protein n=1 Tax=Vaccinium darrowii TaxID=229202 RepID=A0ACB7ZAE1_9ERIC|nr:hypothetical protein Vadar_008487 [Vaccinium darrowii]